MQNVKLLLLPHDEHHHLYNFSLAAIKASAQQAVAAFKDMSGASPFNLSSAFFCIEGERGKELKQTFTDPF